MKRLGLSSPVRFQIVIVRGCAEWTIAVAIQRVKGIAGADIEYAEALPHIHAEDLRSGQPGGFQVQDIALGGIRSSALAGQRGIKIAAAKQMDSSFVFILSADKKIIRESFFKRD